MGETSSDENSDVPNKGPEANVIIWVLVGLATLFLGLRVYCKYRRHSRLWWDDGFLVASWAILIAACILVSVNVGVGFGKHSIDIDPQEFPGMGLRNVIAGSLFGLSSAWSKTSFAVSLLRIATPRIRIVIWFLVISMNILMHGNVILTWVSCRPAKLMWEYSVEGQCWSWEIVLPIGIAISIYSGFMELVLAFLAWSIIIKLEMKLREKIGVAIAMSAGIFAGVTAIVKSSELHVVSEEDYNYNGVELVIRNSAEIAITIIAASIPVLRTLVYDLAWPSSSRRAGRYIHSPPPGRGMGNHEGHIDRTGFNSVERFAATGGQQNPAAVEGFNNDTGSERTIIRQGVNDSAHSIEEGDSRVKDGDKTDISTRTYEMERIQGAGHSARPWI
ncbi:hypothetical protein F4677DRAFT_38227 [Hypoxylon crocopeplum]|nr:hypothetical protein F4677DRAFT_38227 [Hypoxylon crocopeplum]